MKAPSAPHSREATTAAPPSHRQLGDVSPASMDPIGDLEARVQVLERKLGTAETTIAALNASNTFLAGCIGQLNDEIATIKWRQEAEVHSWRQLWQRFVEAENWDPPEPGHPMPTRSHPTSPGATVERVGKRIVLSDWVGER